MNISSVLPGSKSFYRLFYLVPISQIYIYSEFGGEVHLILAFISLLGAVAQHSFWEAVYGPDVADLAELDDDEQIVRRIATVATRSRAPHDYDGTTRSELISEVEIPPRRLPILSLFALVSILSLVIHIWSIYELYIFRHELNFIGFLLLFGLTAVILHGIAQRPWPDSFRMDKSEEIRDSELHKNIKDTLFAFQSDDDVRITNHGYGLHTGVLEFSYVTDREIEDISAEIHAAATACCTLLERLDYPIEEFRISFETSDGESGRLLLEASTVQAYLDGEQTREEYLEEVIDRLELSSGEFKYEG